MADEHAPEGAPDPELLQAIEAAARHVGDGPEARETSPVVLRFDAPRPHRLRLWLLTALLALTASGSGYLWLRPLADPDPVAVEADLRWAVGQVVRRVEQVRRQTGRLPEPADLQGLVSDLVVYERTGDGYRVMGRRGSVRVLFDGTLPLEQWTRLRLYGDAPDTR